jgi:hypothetical protein
LSEEIIAVEKKHPHSKQGRCQKVFIENERRYVANELHADRKWRCRLTIAFGESKKERIPA